MELQKHRCNQNLNAEMLSVKVMTDEQFETLRKQIAAYATICEQLNEMHKTLSAHQDLTVVRLGGMYCEPLMGHKISSRQRWTPTPVQLQILERIFKAGTPSKEKIKEITVELKQHGPLSEINVYNWFQNRRARSKRKQKGVTPVNAESEVETEVHSKDNTKSDQNLCFQKPQQFCSDLQYLNSESNDSLRSTSSFDHLLGFDGMLSNSRSDYLSGKMEALESYNLYHPEGDFNMTG